MMEEQQKSFYRTVLDQLINLNCIKSENALEKKI
jgi:hypothetical protein